MTTAAIPQIKGLPILGNLLDFRHGRLNLFQRVAQECGDIGMFRFASTPVVMINAPEYVHTILVEQSDAFHKTERIRHLLQVLLGDGLLVLEREQHRRHRRLMAPAFQHRRIAAYADVMAGYAEQLAEQLQSRGKAGLEVDLVRELGTLTLWIAGKSLFDADLRGEAATLRNAVTTFMEHINATISAYMPPPLSWPTPANRRFRQALDQVNQLIYRLIDERRRSGADAGDVLSMLLTAQDEDGSRLSDTEVRDEVMTLLFAAHDNMATALAWTFYLLAKHPDVAARLHAEVDRVLQGRTPAVADVANLPYTLQVLKESMRLYPPVYVLSRKTIDAVDLPNGYHIPAGTPVAVCPYLIHRQPEYFPEPERFNPDRFTPENEQRLPRYAYLPFGAGPHTCIGNHFAIMQGQLVLATLVQRLAFELAPGQQVEPQPGMTLRPKDSIRVSVQKRHSAAQL